MSIVNVSSVRRGYVEMRAQLEELASYFGKLVGFLAGITSHDRTGWEWLS